MKKYLLIPLFALVFSSCMDEDIIVPANTSFPFGQISYTDSALFDMAGLADIVQPNADGVLSVFSEDSTEVVTSEMLDTLFDLEPQNVPFDVPTGLNIPAGGAPGTLYNLTNPVLLEVEIEGLEEDERIDTITFADCSVQVNITNAPAGSSLSEAYWEIVELASWPVNRTANIAYDISGGTLVPLHKTGTDGKPAHFITLKITGRVPAMEQFVGNVIIDCKKMRRLTGNVGKKVIKVDSAKFSFSEELGQMSDKVKEVYFANPMLTLNYHNTFDVPVTIVIDDVKIDGKTVNLSTDPLKTRVDVLPKTSGVFVFDNSNTANNDLSASININTKTVLLSTTAYSNITENNDTYLPNVLTDEDHLDVVYRVDMPLVGYMDGLQFEQTYDNVTFGVEDVEWQEMTFAFTGTNSILLDFYIDLYAFDSTGQPMLLTSQPIHIPASLSETEPYPINQEESFAVLSKEQVDAIDSQKKLMIRYRAGTKDVADHTIVRLLAGTGLQLNLLVGAKADAKS